MVNYLKVSGQNGPAIFYMNRDTFTNIVDVTLPLWAGVLPPATRKELLPFLKAVEIKNIFDDGEHIQVQLNAFDCICFGGCEAVVELTLRTFLEHALKRLKETKLLASSQFQSDPWWAELHIKWAKMLKEFKA